MQIFQATFEYFSGSGAERVATSSTIHFQADDPKGAVRDAVRWYHGRQRAWSDSLSDTFGKLLALTVWGWTPTRIDDSGNKGMEAAFPFFQWKCDRGASPGEELRPTSLGPGEWFERAEGGGAGRDGA